MGFDLGFGCWVLVFEVKLGFDLGFRLWSSVLVLRLVPVGFGSVWRTAGGGARPFY